MKIMYNFANGETSVVEVSEEVGEIIMSSRRKEHADDERQRYHTAQYLDGGNYLCDELADDTSMEDEIIDRIVGDAKRQHFYEVFNQLTPIQQRRVRLKAEGLSYSKIAEIEGCDVRAVFDSIKQAKKIFEKLF